MTLFAIDDIDVSTAVISDGLVLTTSRDGQMSLYVTDGGRARSLGTFASVKDAWAAIDAIDLAQGTVPSDALGLAA